MSLRLIYPIFFMTLLFCWQSLSLAEDGGIAKESGSVQADNESPVIDITGDSGIEAVQEAAVSPDAKFIPNQSATETLQEFTDSKNWGTGWDEQKKRFFLISSAAMNLEEPSSDPDFYAKREMLAKRAVLRAKSDIILYINTQMSASDRLTIPGTDINSQFGAANDAAEAKLRSQKLQLARLLREHDEAQADALEGATARDRVYALIDSAILKLDKQYSVDEIEKKKADRFARTKTKYLEAVKELDKIESAIEKSKGQVQSTQTSTIERLSSMPLIGATVLESTESWNPNDEKYEIAMLVCWSAKLELAARAALTGEAVVTGSSATDETMTVQQWLRSRELGQMVGPRQFVDSSGQRWFIGVTARPVSKNTSTDERNREKAKEFASQMSAFSLFADVDTQTRAKQMMSVVSTSNLNRSETQVIESLEQEMSQSFKNMKIQGLGMLANRIVTHPLTDQEIHVAAYGISPSSAKSAMKIERQASLAAIQVHKNQAFRRERSNALSTAVNAAKNDAASMQAGRNQGRAEAGTSKAPNKKTGEARTAPAKTKAGSTKVGDVKDDI